MGPPYLTWGWGGTAAGAPYPELGLSPRAAHARHATAKSVYLILQQKNKYIYLPYLANIFNKMKHTLWKNIKNCQKMVSEVLSIFIDDHLCL